MPDISSNSSPIDTARSRILSGGMVLLLLVLGLSSVPLGSNRDWAWPVVTIICLLLGMTVVINHGRFVWHRRELAMLSMFALLMLWMLVQLIGVPGLLAPLSIDAFATRSEILKTLGLACFFAGCICLAASRTHLRLMIYAVVIVGLLQALIGGAQQLLFDLPRSRGTFANPNHFAGYLEVALSLAVGLILSQQGERNHSSHPVIEFLAGPRGRLRIMIVIMVVALIMSRSRMGNLAFLTSILLTSGVAFFYARKVSRNMVILLGSILLLDILIIGNYFGLERLEERLRDSPRDAAGRVELFGYNVQIIGDNPVAGVGAGAYEAAMRAYRDEHLAARIAHAENDYLEFLVELGVVGAVPLLLILLLGIRAQLAMMSNSNDTFVRGIAFGCLMGTVCLLIHASADVNLQIPSNGLLLVFLLALPFCLARLKPDSVVTE